MCDLNFIFVDNDQEFLNIVEASMEVARFSIMNIFFADKSNVKMRVHVAAIDKHKSLLTAAKLRIRPVF